MGFVIERLKLLSPQYSVPLYSFILIFACSMFTAFSLASMFFSFLFAGILVSTLVSIFRSRVRSKEIDNTQYKKMYWIFTSVFILLGTIFLIINQFFIRGFSSVGRFFFSFLTGLGIFSARIPILFKIQRMFGMQAAIDIWSKRDTLMFSFSPVFEALVMGLFCLMDVTRWDSWASYCLFAFYNTLIHLVICLFVLFYNIFKGIPLTVVRGTTDGVSASLNGDIVLQDDDGVSNDNVGISNDDVDVSNDDEKHVY